MGNLSPEGPETEGWRAPSASYKNDGTFPQRVAQGQGLSPWELGSKIVHKVSPNQDKTKAKEERTEDVSQHASRTSRPLELLEVDALGRRGQTGEGKCRDPLSWRSPCSRLSK